MTAHVQVFGRRNDGLSTHSEGRRPKSAKARNRGLGMAVVPQLWGFRRGLRRRCGGTRRQRAQFCHAAWRELNCELVTDRFCNAILRFLSFAERQH